MKLAALIVGCLLCGCGVQSDSITVVIPPGISVTGTVAFRPPATPAPTLTLLKK